MGRLEQLAGDVVHVHVIRRPEPTVVYLRPIQGLELVHVIDGGVKIEIEDGVAPAECGYPVEAGAESSLRLVLGHTADVPSLHVRGKS